jgi:hypothetical protein
MVMSFGTPFIASTSWPAIGQNDDAVATVACFRQAGAPAVGGPAPGCLKTLRPQLATNRQFIEPNFATAPTVS